MDEIFSGISMGSIITLLMIISWKLNTIIEKIKEVIKTGGFY